MKVGIFTFHHVYNYGALLQAYALKKAISELGHEPLIFDLRPFQSSKSYWSSGWGIKRKLLLRRIEPKYKEFLKRKRFSAFRVQHLNLTKKYKTLKEAINMELGLEALVVGSDQVWNSKYSENALRTYLLTDAQSLKIPKISYAACCGNPEQPQELFVSLKNHFHRFTSISVRNSFTRKFVEDLTGLNCSIVADPTVLFEWNGAFQSEPLPDFPSQYIFVYGFGELTSHIVLQVKRKLCLPVVAVGMENEYELKGADILVHDAGPKEWLLMLKNATYVCTKSFHGMLLAMKCRKPFIAITGKPPGLFRLRDAAERYGVSKRLVATLDDIEDRSLLESPINYSFVSHKLSQHKNQSIEFLKNSLTPPDN
jgi:hypothetical protein